MALSWQQYLRPTLEQLWDTIPVPIEELAYRHGIEIHRRFMSDRVAAILHRLDDRWYLYLNVTHSRERQRFTVAHELSHVISYGNGHSFSTPDFCMASRECYADYCAARILMPSWKVRWFLSENVPLTEMARRFAVSRAAMRYRLDEFMREEVARERRTRLSVSARKEEYRERKTRKEVEVVLDHSDRGRQRPGHGQEKSNIQGGAR